MPLGLPSAAALIESDSRKVSFFSIDTDVLQSLGFKFNDGALSSLKFQRPIWLELHLTELVAREVMSHRMDALTKALQELNSSFAQVQRLTGQNLSQSQESVTALTLEDRMRNQFFGELQTFVTRLNGSIWPLGGATLAADMFARYFDERPPFETRKDKKSEFPDAAALLVLEAYAKEKKTQGILVSNDKGWENFANQSDYLYCVKSLANLVEVFQSTGPNRDLVRAKVVASLSDQKGDLYLEIQGAVSHHIENADWRVRDAYTSTSLRLDAEVIGVGCMANKFDLDSVRLWIVDHDPSLCTVEFSVTVRANLDIQIDFYGYDTIDHDEFSVASDEVNEEADVEMTVFLTCRGDLLSSPLEDWEVDVSVSGEDFRVKLGEVKLPFDEDE